MSEQEMYVAELMEESNEFRITDDSTADWAIEQINDDREERDRMLSLVKEKMERLEEKHDHYKCKDCPFIEMDNDKRKKCFPCVQKWQTRVDSPCCEWFYKQLEAGHIKVGE